MALQSNWNLSAADIEAMLSTPFSLKDSFLDKVMSAEAKHVEAGIRHALGLWVSELEPILMYRMGKTRPYGVTAKGPPRPRNRAVMLDR